MIREGRLGKVYDKEVALFTSSLAFDADLFQYDILTDLAHLIMLFEQGIVDRAEANKIFAVLKSLHDGGIKMVDLEPGFEDIHMAIEEYVIKEAGATGGMLHTGRSRNDKVACDLRMKTREDLILLSKALLGLVIALLEVSEKNTLTLLPSFTHLQHAQPTTFAHHLLSYVNSLMRSVDRLEEAYARINLCPLGAGAVTTTSFPIDRDRTAELLGFEEVLENSMDAVSSRDYMVELASVASLISLDISRISEELILWSTSEFSFIELSDSFASTSSIMPQKKNPDVLEIIRARTATSTGDLNTLLAMLRSLPQSYNRDLQELSPVFFRGLSTVSTSLTLLAKVVGTMTVNVEKMNAACLNDFSTATELADLIVKEKKIPFRTAHQIVGTAVSKAIKAGQGPNEITSGDLDKIAVSITGTKLGLSDEEVTSALTPLLAVKARNIIGGPAPSTVEKSIRDKFDRITEKENNLGDREKRLKNSKKVLLEQVNSILGE